MTKGMGNWHIDLHGVILLATFIVCLVSSTAWGRTASASTTATGTEYFVSPDGDDADTGLSREHPLKSIQLALDSARAGDRIHLLPGQYWQDIRTTHGGAAGKPITLTGTEKSILKGAGAGRIMEIRHSHITLSGFVIDGKVSAREYRKKLIYAKGIRRDTGITGLRVQNMILKNAGDECLRLKYFAHHNEVGNSRFENCGVNDFQLQRGKKNGEAIYIGTAPEQVLIDKNPTRDVDASDHNRIYRNHFNTNGNECVDIKEGSSFNIVEYNYCTGQKDPKSAGFDSRGNHNIFRHNTVVKNIGAGFRLGGDTPADGIKNTIYNNIIHSNAGGGIKLLAWPQDRICGNELTDNGKDVVGKYRDRVKPASQCM